ncbi:MAG: hypothetical protein KGZ87_05515 [Bacteroidetes bacterium]|nr:hypothetical protein [Bacteroidota bacterium]
MSVITIKSGKVQGGLFLQYSFEEKKEECTETVTKKSDLPIHEDCQTAYVNLIPHLILLCEQEPINDTIKNAIYEGINDINYDDCYFKNYKVSEFKITGSTNSEGVVISGSRYLSTGKSIGLSTPFIRWDDEEYKFIEELIESIEALREEVYQYSQGKHAPLPKQTSFDFDEDLEEEEDHSPTGKVKKMVSNLKEQGITIEVSSSVES